MRDQTIDGYRAVAALGVVWAHTADYRFASTAPHFMQRLAGPLAETSVDLFFVISGYIITTLLLRERDRTGRISIPAFYVRRVFRIIPPLSAVLAVVGLLGLGGRSLAMAATFTCNIGQCSWFVAHTWSLSVEEQFYLLWPLMLVTLSPKPSAIFACVVAMLLAFLVLPFHAHSNFISFACIGAGALYASAPKPLPVSIPAWIAAAAYLTLAPLYLLRGFEVLTPFVIVYLLFATPDFVKAVLRLKPVQVIGLSSYSLYLWQQLFLGGGSTLSLWMLPAVVTLSVVLIERPFIKLGRSVLHLPRAHVT